MRWVIWLRRISLGLIAIVAIVAGVLAIYVWRSVPTDNAQYAIKAPLGETVITLDAEGIPTIEAKSERDLSFAVGFMHARDRLWQLEMNRRIGRGELAEILGPKALETDKFLRTLGVHRAAKTQLDGFPPEAKALLQAYADGVNTYVRDAMTVRPPEFVILGVQPGLWSPWTQWPGASSWLTIWAATGATNYCVCRWRRGCRFQGLTIFCRRSPTTRCLHMVTTLRFTNPLMHYQSQKPKPRTSCTRRIVCFSLPASKASGRTIGS